MKKIITLAVIMATFMPAQAQACSLCVPLEKALKAAWEWLEYSDCLRQRLRYSQLTGRPIPPCDHNGKHDRPAK